MPEALKVPEAVRLRLKALYEAQQAAIGKLPEVHAFTHAISTAMEFLGLDAGGNHNIDFTTGTVTPDPRNASKPTLVRDESATG